MRSGKNLRNTALAVGELFFPQSKSLGIDRTQFSQEIQSLIVYAGTTSTSYAQSQNHLERLVGLKLTEHHVRRVCLPIGQERFAERDAATAVYRAMPLTDRKKAPGGVQAPNLAVVGVDGGCLQIWERSGAVVAADEGDEQEEIAKRAESGRHWREDKIGVLMTMSSDEYKSDPCPEIPGNFVDRAKMTKLVREFGKSAPTSPDAVKPEAEVAETKSDWKPPKSTQKVMVASRRKWADFGPMVASSAWEQGFYGAKRKAFVGDGASKNWTMWANHFSSFTPILDFIHALTYVFAGAMAARDYVSGWVEYDRWIRWVWQGKVSLAIVEMEAKLATLGERVTNVATDPREVLRRVVGYLKNNESRMKYSEYRKAGLPINSSVVESTVKQFNYRVKGSEKFWNEEGAESMLQLRADELSDTQPLLKFWRRRAGDGPTASTRRARHGHDRASQGLQGRSLADLRSGRPEGCLSLHRQGARLAVLVGFRGGAEQTGCGSSPHANRSPKTLKTAAAEYSSQKIGFFANIPRYASNVPSSHLGQAP
jgi:hypothetical protein